MKKLMHGRTFLKKFVSFIILIASLIFSISSVSVHAEFEELLISPDAPCYNGHYYMVYDDLNSMENISWETAQRLCNARGGHLAVISSAEENDFVYNYLSYSGISSAFFGLYRDDTNWKWVTDEEVVYDNLDKSEYTGGKYGMYSKQHPDGKWHDGNYGIEATAYICEWDSGISCQDAVLSIDENGDEIFPENTISLSQSKYKIYNSSLTAVEASNFCKKMKGHLAFINSEEEQEFLMNAITEYGTKNMYWIGAREVSSGSWMWLNESEKREMSYSNWSYTEPNNPDGDSIYAVINKTSSNFPFGAWIAESAIGAEYREIEYCANYGFICEWEMMCISDQGQYLTHIDDERQSFFVKATCTEAGKVEHRCIHCGQLISSNKILPSGHNFELELLFGKFEFNPIPGLKKYKCSLCGKSKYQMNDTAPYFYLGGLILLIIMLLAYRSAKADTLYRKYVKMTKKTK